MNMTMETQKKEKKVKQNEKIAMYEDSYFYAQYRLLAGKTKQGFGDVISL